MSNLRRLVGLCLDICFLKRKRCQPLRARLTHLTSIFSQMSLTAKKNNTDPESITVTEKEVFLQHLDPENPLALTTFPQLF